MAAKPNSPRLSLNDLGEIERGPQALMCTFFIFINALYIFIGCEAEALFRPQ